MAKERDERLYLADISGAIDRILRYTASGREAFFRDPMTQDAVVRNLEVMGEAVKGLGETVRAAHPQVPWKKIAGMRDRVIHGYFQVDLDIVWEVVEKELPTLRQQLTAILG
jgi:uncharacterized protein with HEPN domain